VRADLEAAQGEERFVRFEISDTGIGITEAAQATLFEKFTQADVSTTRKFGGSGLGLTIAKQIVELLDGEIGLESEPGMGSTFWFRIPCREGDPAACAGEAGDEAEQLMREPGERRVRLLVAEDNRVNQMIITAMLERAGHRVDVVANGLEAVTAVLRTPYDAVLMDINMPEMDGRAATRKIRDLQGGEGGVPIIALTANAMAGDREAYLAVGMNDYVSKPIEQAELFLALRRCLGTDVARPVDIDEATSAGGDDAPPDAEAAAAIEALTDAI
jgi:CheY-like chemotaxis protein